MVIMLTGEPCEKVVEERRVRDGVMPVVLVIEEDVLRLVCGHALRIGSLDEEAL